MFVPASVEDKDLTELLEMVNKPKEKIREYESEHMMLQKELKNYDRKFLNVKDLDYKKTLENLIKQRDDLREREDSLISEIARFRDVYYKSENMRLEGDKIDQKFLEDRKMKIHTLKVFKNKLENERLYILDTLQKIQTGELPRKNTSGIQAANEILVDGNVPYHDIIFMKGKIEDDAKKLYVMKVD